MSLVKYNRTPSLFKIFFDDPFTKDMFLNENGDVPSRVTIPKANIMEDDKQFTLELALPGFKKENLNIELENERLKISSKNTEEKVEENGKVHLREFSSSSYERFFTIPENVEADKISAKYEDGVLKVYLPKNEKAKAEAIRQIKVG